MATRFSERGPFTWLLIAQLSFFVIAPLLSGWAVQDDFIVVGVFAIVLAGLYASAARKGLLIVSSILVLPAILAWIGPDFFQGTTDEVLRLMTAAICFFFTVLVIILAVIRHETVTTETILGGINAYLLLGLTFMLLHAAVLVAEPGAYLLDGQRIGVEASHRPGLDAVSAMLYFSFTTITTLGYGDITPQTSVARLLTSAEAVTGQLYFAIFLARLVSMGVSQRHASRDKQKAEAEFSPISPED